MGNRPENNTKIDREELLNTRSNRFSEVQSEDSEKIVDRDSKKSGRRGVIKGIAASVVSVIGMSGLTSAKSTSVSRLEKKKLLQKYEDKDKIRDIFNSHRKLFKNLTNDDVLNETSLNHINFDITYDNIDIEKDTPVVHLGAIKVEDRTIPKLEFFQNDSDGLLQIAVFPDQDHYYAFFDQDSSDNEVSKYGDGPVESTLDVSPQRKCTYYRCCACRCGLDDRCPEQCDSGTCVHGYCCCTCGLANPICCL